MLRKSMAIWASGPLLVLAFYTLALPCLVLRRLLRPRRLDRRMARSRVRLSHDRPQIKRRPLILATPPGRNGHRKHSRRLRRER